MDCDATIDANNNDNGDCGDCGGGGGCGGGVDSYVGVTVVVDGDMTTGKPERKIATDLPESEGKICFLSQNALLGADAIHDFRFK